MAEIRKIQSGEFARCVEVMHKSFAELAEQFGLTPQSCPTDAGFITLERLLFEESNGVELFGAFENGEQVGVCALNKRENECVLEKLGVLPQCRHNGIGTMLVGFAKARTRQLGYNEMHIGIIDEFVVLKAWFKSCGFEEISCRNYPTVPYTVCNMKTTV